MRKEVETSIGKLFVESGITPVQVAELVAFASSDDEVKKNTHDQTRFATRQKASEWLSKGKTVYTLTNRTGGLLGIVWFEESSFPEEPLTEEIEKGDYKHTFAIRIYPPARHKGLAGTFMSACFEDSGLKKVWLSVKMSNEPGIKAYKRFGFRQITAPNEDERIIMVYSGA